MQLLNLRVDGLTRFREPAEIDFTQLPAGLVAVTGRNGAGKSSLFEAIFASLYRRFAYYSDGSFYDFWNKSGEVSLALSPDANGSRWEIRTLVNPARRVTESHITVDGEVVPGVEGRKEAFLEYVSERLGPRELATSSVYLSQNGHGGFLDMSAQERRELFRRLLGLEEIERLSQEAKTRRGESELKIANAQGRIDLIEVRVDEDALAESSRWLADAEQGLAQVEESAAYQHKEIEERREDKRSLQSSIERHQESLKRAEELRKAVRPKEDRIGEIEGEISKLSQELFLLDFIESDEAALETAVAEQEALEARRDARRAAEDRVKRTRGVRAGYRRFCERLFESLESRDREIESADENARNLLRKDLESAGRELEAAKAAKELLGEQTRGEICETCPLLDDGRRTAGRIPGLEEKIEDLRRRIEAPPDPRLHTLRLRCHRARARESAHASRLWEIIDAAERALKEASPVQPGELDAAAENVRKIRADLADKARMPQIRERIEEKERTKADLEKDVAGIRAELDSLKSKSDELKDDFQRLEVLSREIGAKEETLRELNAEHERLKDLRARLKAAIEGAEADGRALKRLSEWRDALNADRARWDLIHNALGPTGYQILAIDAAGPEVSTLINDLLSSCFGSRFSVFIETEAAKAAGRGTKEVFDVRVIDNERAREGSSSQFSGGEKVIIGEAVGLGLALYNRRRSGNAWRTLMRDETAGALDEENARRYVNMLRRALELGDFHQLYFVAHDPALWELADARINVGGGRISIE